MKFENNDKKRKAAAGKLIWTLCVCVLTLAFANSPIGAQIKIPKIFRPKTNQPTQPTSQNPTAAPSENNQQTNSQSETISQTAGNFIDDGFTWFEAVSFQEPVNGTRTDLGWALKSTIRLMGDHPRRSAFKITISKAGKPLATTRCEAFPEASRYTGVIYLWTLECFKKETAIKDLGKFDVQIAFVNGDTDAETVLRNYKIEVLKADRVTGPTMKPIADAPQYYLSRHAEAPASILFLRPEGKFSYVGNSGNSSNSGAGANEVEIYFSLSPSKEGTGTYMRNNYLRCTVDGKPLELQNDKVEIETVRRYAQVYSDRLAAQYKTSGTPYQEEIEFLWLRAELPVTFGTNAPDAHETNFNNHPGKWECNLTNNGATLRTWRWTVNRDGMATKHPEQNGNVNLFYNSYLLDTEIPAGGTLIDKRLAPVSLAEGFFYGQPWTTAEGKAMAAKVPTKGTPAPVPSNKLK